MLDIILLNVDPVYAGDGQYGISLKIQLGFSVAPFNYGKLPLQDWGEEVPSSARWLQEPRVYPFRFVFHKVKHGVDFSFPSQYFAMIRHTLSGFYLFFLLYPVIHCNF